MFPVRERVNGVIVHHFLKEVPASDTASAGWDRPASQTTFTLADKQQVLAWSTEEDANNDKNSLNSVEMSPGTEYLFDVHRCELVSG